MARVQVQIDGVWINVENVQTCKATKALNGLGKFNGTIREATLEQVDQIVANTPFRLIDGDQIFEGVIQKANGEVEINFDGGDYSILLQTKMLHEDDLSEENTSLSSGYNVVYTNKEFRLIVIDIATAMGLTADSSSVDAFGDLNIRFKRTYGIEAIKELAKQTGYEWIVDNDKKLFMKQDLGTSTASAYMDLTAGARLTRKETDDQRRCTRAIVFGSGNTEGSYEDATYIGAGEVFEGRFKFDSLSTNAMCNQRAEEIVKEFKDEILILNVMTYTQGYAIGDVINLRGRKLDGDYRITALTLDITGERELDVTNVGRKHRRDSPEEMIEKIMKGATNDVAVITSGDDVQDLSYTHNDIVGPDKYWVFDFYVDPENVSDILKAELFVTRENISRIYGDATSNSFTGAGINNASQNANHGLSNANQNAGHGISNAEAGSPSTGYDRLNLFDSLATGGWVSAGSSTSISNNPHFFHLIFGVFQTTIDHGAGSSVGQTIRVRAYNTSTGEYYPDSGGIYALFEGYQGVGIERYIIPFNLFIPRSWQNNSYRLEYNISSSLPGGFTQALDYGYYGSRGHSHSNSITGGTHQHSNSLTGGNHTHTNSFSDAQHNNSLSINPSDFDPGGSRTVGVYVNGTFIQNITLSALGSNQTLDIGAELTSPGQNQIELRPNGNVFLVGGVNLKVFKS